MISPYHQSQKFLPPTSSSNPPSNPPQPPKSTSMPTQPNPNPNNKPPQPLYHSEMANFPSYPINIVELDGVQLRSGKALKGPTIIEEIQNLLFLTNSFLSQTLKNQHL